MGPPEQSQISCHGLPDWLMDLKLAEIQWLF
jgi:hypothetical protein